MGLEPCCTRSCPRSNRRRLDRWGRWLAPALIAAAAAAAALLCCCWSASRCSPARQLVVGRSPARPSLLRRRRLGAEPNRWSSGPIIRCSARRSASAATRRADHRRGLAADRQRRLSRTFRRRAAAARPRRGRGCAAGPAARAVDGLARRRRLRRRDCHRSPARARSRSSGSARTATCCCGASPIRTRPIRSRSRPSGIAGRDRRAVEPRRASWPRWSTRKGSVIAGNRLFRERALGRSSDGRGCASSAISSTLGEDGGISGSSPKARPARPLRARATFRSIRRGRAAPAPSMLFDSRDALADVAARRTSRPCSTCFRSASRWSTATGAS